MLPFLPGGDITGNSVKPTDCRDKPLSMISMDISCFDVKNLGSRSFKNRNASICFAIYSELIWVSLMLLF